MLVQGSWRTEVRTGSVSIITLFSGAIVGWPRGNPRRQQEIHSKLRAERCGGKMQTVDCESMTDETVHWRKYQTLTLPEDRYTAGSSERLHHVRISEEENGTLHLRGCGDSMLQPRHSS